METVWSKELWAHEKNRTNIENQTHVKTDLATQATISIVLGLSAFLTFCVLRPRWTALYAARKKQKNAASRLPDLPDTLFGWIPVLYRITEEEVLASAGLDAFVFLAFFKMAIRYLAFVLFFSLTVIYPVHLNFDIDPTEPSPEANGTDSTLPRLLNLRSTGALEDTPKSDWDFTLSQDYLWIYVIFSYLFSVVAMYMIVKETKRIIRIRQTFLGTHSSVTDRTIRLSGIPRHLRSEEKIKETIEQLEIGKVESVMLCKEWKELDDLISARMIVLRKLEEAWTVHLGIRRTEHTLETLPRTHHDETGDEDNDDERSGLLGVRSIEQAHGTTHGHDRPMIRIWFGFLNLQSRKIDAIDYYEENLRNLDEKIKDARQKKFPPTPLAFVTLDSIAACQMAVQAILDPEPRQLMANTAPAPADVVWRNTYLSRSHRMTRAWTITALVTILTVVWWFVLGAIAALLNFATIRKISPPLADALERHEIIRSLVQNFLPTVVISLLNVVVPYLYEWLSNLQGMISQGDVELSIISKNYFFTFFNLFIVFTVFGTASNVYDAPNLDDARDQIGELLKDIPRFMRIIAESLEDLAPFYMNLIVLQGLGLFPLRLLEFGAVSLYPVNLFGAKTPRDFAELVQPPMFSYGFFLPQTLFIFIICIVYSILKRSELVTFFGLIYFIIGSFVYKYQLLYAMDHRQHSTGRAWSIICHRIIVGLAVFQFAMAGQLALKLAIRRSILILPLLIGTIWFGYFYRRTYNPLMKFIALRSLHGDDDGEPIPLIEPRDEIDTNGGAAVDDSEETGLRFINPSLVVPLEDVWLAKKRANGVADSNSLPPSPSRIPAAPLITYFETNSLHILILGSPPRSIGIRYIYDPVHPVNPTRTLQQVSFIEVDSLTSTNESAVEHFHAMTSLNSSEPHVRWTLVVGDTDTDAGHNDDNANDDAISASIIHHHDNTHPRRPRAPTPSPPPFYSSSSSSSSEDGDSNDNQEESPTSGTQSPLRGRPRSLLGENHNLVSRATARRRAGPSSIDFSELLRPAGTFALPLPTPAFPEEQPLPMLYLSTPTVNEVLSHASTMNSVTGVDLSTFGGHRDTFAMLDLQCLPWPAVELPFAVFVRLDSFLDAESYFALRLTCRCWSAALTAVHPPSYKFSAAQRSPTELLHLIYADLEPVDFNAARRVCRGWMMAGLEGGLLEEMLRKGGWWAGLLADREVRREGRRGSVGVEWEWVMSKRLSTECALGRGWTGCGFSDGEESTDAVMLETEGGTARPGIKLTARTDFSELASAVTSGELDSALQFTVSLCGKFLLVAEGCVIYIYQLCETDRRGSTPTFTHGGSLEYFTSIVCPKKVLAVSMDTSSRRFAVATLLNDRTGMVCDLDLSRLTVRNDEIQRQRKSIWGPELSKMDASPSPEPSNSNPTTQPPTPGDANNVQFQSYPVFEHPQVNHVAYHVAPLPLNTPVPQSIISTSALSNRPAPLNPRSIYRSLCSLTDPPLSVAICPQRRCVAFGCSSGIELHWVDALTGQDLNRWFPLTAPSDFLYFLPPRRGVDSAKKLRLISSAGCAGQRGSLRNRFEGGWGAEESAWWREDGRTRWETEHWRAVPLGDGEMVLYTDPETGLLALGGDTPMRGPTRLERSFMFKGPVGAVPTVYAAGSELRWGVRVVVGYEDSLWLFCIPPDTFGEEKERRKRSVVPGAVEEAREGPTLIQGTEIGKVEGLLDVAVDSSGGSLTVWAFAAGGMAYTYQLDDGNNQRLRKRAVQRDGVVLDLEDADGDVIMRDAPPVFHPTDFDGTYSLSGYSARPSISSLADADMTRATDRIVNPVTEVEMRDEDEGYWSSDEGSPARGTFAIHVPPLEGRWSVEEEGWEWDVDYLGVGVGMGMDLMEMGRLECEVL